MPSVYKKVASIRTLALRSSRRPIISVRPQRRYPPDCQKGEQERQPPTENLQIQSKRSRSQNYTSSDQPGKRARTMVGPQPIKPDIAATYTCPKELAQFAAREWPERARPLRHQYRVSPSATSCHKVKKDTRHRDIILQRYLYRGESKQSTTRAP